MSDTVFIHCPWCFETVEIAVEEDVWGEMVQDCEVCCRPWRLESRRDRYGDPEVTVDRSE